MNTNPTADLIALQIRFNGRSASFPKHTESNIAERVKFVQDLLPAFTILDINYQAGDKLRSILSIAIGSDQIDLVDLKSQAQIALDGYRARLPQLRSDAYQYYVTNTTRYNDQYKYHRRVKQKQILSEAEFLSSIPAL